MSKLTTKYRHRYPAYFRKYFGLLLVFCLIPLSNATNAQSEEFVHLSHNGQSFPPYVWYPENGRIQGIIPALEDELFIAAGYRVKRKNYGLLGTESIPMLARDLRTGKIDALLWPKPMATIRAFPELIFIEEPVFKLSIVIYFSARNKDSFRTVKDLKGAKGSFPRMFEQIRKLNPVLEQLWNDASQQIIQTGGKEVMESLASGEIDFRIGAKHVPLAYMAADPKTNHVAFLPGDEILTVEYQLGISKASFLAKRIEPLNEQIRQLTHSGKDVFLIRKEQNKYISHLRSK